MRRVTTVAAAVAASLALAGGAVAAFAQGAAQQRGRMIEVPPGAVVIVLPGPQTAPWTTSRFNAGWGFPELPGPSALIRQIDQQMDQMMAQMRQAFAAPAWTAPAWSSPDRMIQAEFGQLPPGASRVVVTSFSDGHNTCTRRIVYSGGGAAPKVQVSDTGNACAAAAMPSASPEWQPRARPAARTIEALYHPPVSPPTPARPLQLAELSR